MKQNLILVPFSTLLLNRVIFVSISEQIPAGYFRHDVGYDPIDFQMYSELANIGHTIDYSKSFFFLTVQGPEILPIFILQSCILF